MSINKRQFDLLQAMGITVWQRRNLSKLDISSATANNTSNKAEKISGMTLVSQSSTQSSQALSLPAQQASNKQAPNGASANINLKTLLKQALFNDIIRCLGVSHADLTVNKDRLDLGLINWQFIDDNHVEFEHNCLRTPKLSILANSPALKKALWQSIGPLSSQ